jgi:hypothetical protein
VRRAGATLSPAPVADPLRLSAGRALTWPSQALAPYVAQQCSSRPSSPDPARLCTPIDAHRRILLSQSCTVTHRLGIRASTAQGVFNWVDPTFRWSRPRRRRCSYVRSDPSTCFAFPRSPPSQGFGLSSPAIERNSQQRRRTAWSPKRDASHQSLQPTCCHEHPQEPPISKPWALTLRTAVTLRAS